MQRYKIGCSYFGPAFRGWQANVGIKSVQSTVEDAIERFVGAGNSSSVVVSSRTDAGVHALHNVFHVDLQRRRRWTKELMAPHDEATVRVALNRLLDGQGVRIAHVRQVSDNFHARHSAVSRTYTYRLAVTSEKYMHTHACVFDGDRMWWLSCPLAGGLDVASMRCAAQALIGKHDFSSFRASKCQAKSPVRTLDSIDIRLLTPSLTMPLEPAQVLHITVRARSFLHHMVRNIVGTLVEVGTGRIPASRVKEILAARDRQAAPGMAPAHGLYLAEVGYPDEWR